MKESIRSHSRFALIEQFDRHMQYVGPKLERDIRENRVGTFSLQFFDADGARIYPDEVTVNQTSHEFKFGCSLFLLDQFPEPKKTSRTARRSRKFSTAASRRSTGIRSSPKRASRAFPRLAEYLAASGARHRARLLP